MNTDADQPIKNIMVAGQKQCEKQLSFLKGYQFSLWEAISKLLVFSGRFKSHCLRRLRGEFTACHNMVLSLI